MAEQVPSIIYIPASTISGDKSVVRDNCSVGQSVEQLACIKHFAKGNVRGYDVVVDENRLLWNVTHCDGECMETFRSIEGPKGATRFE